MHKCEVPAGTSAIGPVFSRVIPGEERTSPPRALESIPMLSAQTLSISIDRPYDEVYEFAHRPQNFPLWADGLGSGLEARPGNLWATETPLGMAEVEFSPRNAFGVLDHIVGLVTGPVYVPLRVVRNGNGCEVLLTVFRRQDMSDLAYQNDLEAVARDLDKLKGLLEDNTPSVVHVDFENRKK